MSNIENLQKAKDIIYEWFEYADCGLYDCGNIAGDPIAMIYNDDGLKIFICYDYGYFEVFGLDCDDFEELRKFYAFLCDR